MLSLIRCSYGEHEATIDFDGNVLEGDLPRSKLKLVDAWIELHSTTVKSVSNMGDYETQVDLWIGKIES